MSNRKQIYTIGSIRILIIALIIITFTVPVFLGNLKTNSLIDYTPSEDALNSSEFTKDNYTAILTDEDYGLGSVTIDDMHFNTFLKGIDNNSEVYPLLDEDIIISGALKIDTESVEFIETITPAIVDNLNGTNRDIITVKLNESLKITYNNPQEGYLIYHSHFSGAKLLDFYVNNDSSIIKLDEGIDYTIDSLEYIVFYYEDYFNLASFNFTMYLIWEYGLRLQEWSIEQTEETPLIMREREQNFTSRFLYKFFLLGYMVIPDLSGTIPVDYIDVALTINPPDKELLSYQAMNINTFDKNVNNYVNTDKSFSIEISDLFRPNASIFLLNFTCSFGLKFEEPVGNSWAIDRLVAGRNIRERIYFISMITGPPHIFLKNVALYDTGIYFDQAWKYNDLNYVSASSLFNRKVLLVDANASTPRQLGLKVTMPYLIVGETSPFSIEYIASQALKIVVTDTIKMPLAGVSVEILHFGAIYGTYISNESVQPINSGRTDENGQVVLYDVPRGNYTARVTWEGKVVTEATVTTDMEVNYVYTNVPHFPLWILIFGMISGIVLVVGALFYLKYKKLR